MNTRYGINPLSEQSEKVKKILADAWLAHPEAHAKQLGLQIYQETARERGWENGIIDEKAASGIPPPSVSVASSTWTVPAVARAKAITTTSSLQRCIEIQARFALSRSGNSRTCCSYQGTAENCRHDQSGLFELIGQSIPERVKANIGKVMSNPWFGSEGKPIRRKVVNLNLERGENRNGIISDLFQASEGYAGVEGLDNILKKATKEELKQFNELIK